MRTCRLIFALFVFLVLGCTSDNPVITEQEFNDPSIADFTGNELAARNTVQSSGLYVFMPAGPLGGPGNLLTPGDFFPPIGKSKATLKRGRDYVQFNIHTTGLPPGAYTVWYVIFNNSGDCGGPGGFGGVCGEPDLFLSSTAVVWATGKVVKSNGIGNFSDRIYVGEQRSETIILGGDLTSPLEDPAQAEVHLIIKYHGAASDDPDTLYEQLTTLLGSCGEDEGANSFDGGPGFGIQCFDPQFAVFPSP